MKTKKRLIHIFIIIVLSTFTLKIYSQETKQKISGIYYWEETCDCSDNKTFNSAFGSNCLSVQFLPKGYGIYIEHPGRKKPFVFKYEIENINGIEYINCDFIKGIVKFKITKDYNIICLQRGISGNTTKEWKRLKFE